MLKYKQDQKKLAKPPRIRHATSYAHIWAQWGVDDVCESTCLIHVH